MQPFPLMAGDADDLGGAERVAAVDQGDGNVDFGGLAIGIPCRDAFPAGFETLRQHIFASMWRRAWYLDPRPNALPWGRVSRRISVRGAPFSAVGPRTMASAAGQSSFHAPRRPEAPLEPILP